MNKDKDTRLDDYEIASRRTFLYERLLEELNQSPWGLKDKKLQHLCAVAAALRLDGVDDESIRRIIAEESTGSWNDSWDGYWVHYIVDIALSPHYPGLSTPNVHPVFQENPVLSQLREERDG